MLVFSTFYRKKKLISIFWRFFFVRILSWFFFYQICLYLDKPFCYGFFFLLKWCIEKLIQNAFFKTKIVSYFLSLNINFNFEVNNCNTNILQTWYDAGKLVKGLWNALFINATTWPRTGSCNLLDLWKKN